MLSRPSQSNKPSEKFVVDTLRRSGANSETVLAEKCVQTPLNVEGEVMFKGAGDAGDDTDHREKVNLRRSPDVFSGEEDRPSKNSLLAFDF